MAQSDDTGAEVGEDVHEQRGDDELNETAEEEQSAAAQGFAGRCGKCGCDEIGDNALLTDPAVAARKRGEHAVSESEERGDDDHEQAAMAYQDAEESCDGHAEGYVDHGRQIAAGDGLLAAEAGVHGSAGGDHTNCRMADGDAEDEAERDREGEDEVSAEGLIFPAEYVAIGEVAVARGWLGGGSGGHGVVAV